MGKVIITAALTGNIHTPSMSPYLPVTPQQIIDEAVRCEQAGATIVHVHAREYEEGRPTTSVDIYREILSGIKAILVRIWLSMELVIKNAKRFFLIRTRKSPRIFFILVKKKDIS